MQLNELIYTCLSSSNTTRSDDELQQQTKNRNSVPTMAGTPHYEHFPPCCFIATHLC